MKKEELEEFAKEERKKTTKKKLKNALVLALAGAFCGVFAGCAITSGSSNSTSTGSEIIDDSGSTKDPETPENPQNPQTPVTPTVPEIPEDEISDFLSALALGNFTFETQTDQGLAKYYFQDDSLFTKVGDNWGVYYVYENDKMVRLEYQEDIDKYYKYNETNLLSFDSILYDALVSTDWKNYDQATDTVTGQSGSLEYSLNLADKTLSGDISGRVYDIGSTQVLMPTFIVDKTNESVTPDNPTIIDPTPTESENIYEIVNGEYVFDVVAIKEVLLNWMKGDNKFDKDYLAALLYGNQVTDDIIYVKAAKDRIDFGFVYHDEENKYYCGAYLWNDDLYAKISDKTIKTKTEFLNHLQNLKKAELSIQTDHIQIDTTISDENFETLTENAFKRLEEKGTQGSSVNNDYPETKLENFSDAEVLYGFKSTCASRVNAGYDLGWYNSWAQYYLIKYNGNVEFVRIGICSSTSSPLGVETELDNVLNDSEWWMIPSVGREGVNNDNEKLYNNTSIASLSTNYNHKENKRELI